ncbi:unnamed protein product [Gadus morhua 'NCC']
MQDSVGRERPQKRHPSLTGGPPSQSSQQPPLHLLLLTQNQLLYNTLARPPPAALTAASRLQQASVSCWNGSRDISPDMPLICGWLA